MLHRAAAASSTSSNDGECSSMSKRSTPPASLSADMQVTLLARLAQATIDHSLVMHGGPLSHLKSQAKPREKVEAA